MFVTKYLIEEEQKKLRIRISAKDLSLDLSYHRFVYKEEILFCYISYCSHFQAPIMISNSTKKASFGLWSQKVIEVTVKLPYYTILGEILKLRRQEI